MSDWPGRALACVDCGETWEVFDIPAGYVDAAGYLCPDCRDHEPRLVVEREPVCCQLCQQPGEGWCADRVACNFRARRRLGIPLHACLEYRARDHENIAHEFRATAVAIAAQPRRPLSPEYLAHINSNGWARFADEQRLQAGYRCEWPTCGKVDPDLAVHHVHYERFGQERPEDVLVLCPLCHRDLDAKGRQGLAPVVEVELVGTRRVVTVKAGLWVPRRWGFGRSGAA